MNLLRPASVSTRDRDETIGDIPIAGNGNRHEQHEAKRSLNRSCRSDVLTVSRFLVGERATLCDSYLRLREVIVRDIAREFNFVNLSLFFPSPFLPFPLSRCLSFSHPWPFSLWTAHADIRTLKTCTRGRGLRYFLATAIIRLSRSRSCRTGRIIDRADMSRVMSIYAN